QFAVFVDHQPGGVAEHFDVLYGCLSQNGVTKIEVVIESFRIEFQIAVIDYVVDIVAGNSTLLVVKNWPRGQPIGFKKIHRVTRPLAKAAAVSEPFSSRPAPARRGQGRGKHLLHKRTAMV